MAAPVKKRKAGSGSKKQGLYAVMKTDESDFGIYINTPHIEKSLGISPGNIKKFLDRKLSHVNDYLIVVIEVPKGKIVWMKLEQRARELLLIEKERYLLQPLTNAERADLSDDQVKRILSILNENK